MDEKMGTQSIDEYIAKWNPHTQALLQELRKVIRESAPDATEKISYQMPTFDYYGNLVHFAAYERHIGFYPAPSGMEAFAEELSQYKKGKGSLQFPIGKPIPFDLVRAIVQFRVAENKRKEENRKISRKSRSKE